jgi:glucosamine--fructose-6-phosphate aminotransferase (isomerizing)
VLSVTCSEDNPLARISQKILAFPKAKEEGPIVTKCFTSFLVALTMLVAWYSGSESLVEDLRKAADLFDIKKHQNELQRLASQKFTIYSSLGTGFYLGLAGETDLKIREMGLSPCGYYNTMEFRHGAFCTVNNTYFFICFLSEALKKAEIEAIREFTSLKSQRLLICEEADDRTKMSVEYLIELKSGLSEYARLPLMVPIAQLFAFYQSISKGMNPDKPKYLNPVVILKDRV